MNSEILNSSGVKNIESIRILIFRMSGCFFGIDMDNVTGIRPFDQSRRMDVPVYHFYEIIGFDAGEKKDSNKPMVLTVSFKNNIWGVIIDGLEAVDLPLSLNDIRPMPPLITGAVPDLPFWGVGLHQGEMVLLVSIKHLSL